MSHAPDTPPRVSPDDTLPPVEPPSAGFIVQLFVIPAIIVIIIVIVWGLFNWLARSGTDPASYVDALKRNNEARWQAAVNLANALRNPANEEFRRDRSAAQEVALLLDRELASGSDDDKAVRFREFLCRALGEFEVADGLPVLLKAASTARNESDRDVQRAAVEGIAVLVSHSPALDESRRGQVLGVLLEAARQRDDPLLRGTATYALGVVGGDEAAAQLKAALADAFADVRFDAAMALARRGEASAVEVLVEMLSPETEVLTPPEIAMFDQTAGRDEAGQSGKQTRVDELRKNKRSLVMVNALRASVELARQNPTADVAPLKQAIASLAEGGGPVDIRLQAAEALRALELPAATSTR